MKRPSVHISHLSKMEVALAVVRLMMMVDGLRGTSNDYAVRQQEFTCQLEEGGKKRSSELPQDGVLIALLSACLVLGQRMAAFGCRFDGLAIASRGGNSGDGPITIATATASIIIIISLACSSPFGPSS